MRKIICSISFVVMPARSTCKQYSVKDAEEKDELYSFVKAEDVAVENIKPTSDAIEHTAKSVNGGGITELNIGQSCTCGGYQLKVTDVWHADDNLLILDGIEGHSEFRDFIVTQYNLGDFPSINEDGSFIKGGKEYVIVKMKIKNVSDSASSRKLSISPLLYNKDRESEYTRIDISETMGFDKYKNIDQPEQIHRDLKTYEFAPNEEIETIAVIMVSDSLVTLRDVYLSSDFIDDSSELSASKIPDNSYMIKLNLGRYVQ